MLARSFDEISKKSRNFGRLTQKKKCKQFIKIYKHFHLAFRPFPSPTPPCPYSNSIEFEQTCYSKNFFWIPKIIIIYLRNAVDRLNRNNNRFYKLDSMKNDGEGTNERERKTHKNNELWILMNTFHGNWFYYRSINAIFFRPSSVHKCEKRWIDT